MRVRYVEISNFRGVKSLKTKFDGQFICLIGHGDNCKSTILTAIEYALTSRWNITFDDTDFNKQDTTQPIQIQVTLSNWDNQNEKIKKFFTEEKFGQFIGGLSETGPTEEPADDVCSITLRLTVDSSLEPKWFVVRGQELKAISSQDRSIFGIGRIDTTLDSNFTWSRTSLLSKLSSANQENISPILAQISRGIRDRELDLVECNATAAAVRTDAVKFGVNINELKAKIDIQKISLASGALALHQESIPLRNLGSGSKKLISCSMQMKVNGGHNITLIDEIELGLEPHRIRGLIKNLKASGQQIFTTTHSPVVLRELTVANNEIYTCKKEGDGTITITSLNTVPDSQGPIRSNAEAFLGKKIIVCEGPTEIGCLRALDQIKNTGETIPVWTLNTAYYNAGGIAGVTPAAKALKNLGYSVAVLCDNDDLNAFPQTKVEELNQLGIPTFIWDLNMSTEKQLFNDLKWAAIEPLLNRIVEVDENRTKESLIASTKSNHQGLSDNVAEWVDSNELRADIGKSAGTKANAWFKRMYLAEGVFNLAIPQLKDDSTMKTKLELLWQWVQNE